MIPSPRTGKFLRGAAALAASALAAAGLSGCGTVMTGVRTPVEIRSDMPGVTVESEDTTAATPVVLSLRRRHQELLLRAPGDSSAHRLRMRRGLNGWLWANFAIGPYGLPGFGIDFLLGGAFRLVPDRRDLPGLPEGITVNTQVDPVSGGNWRVAAAYMLSLRSFPSGADSGYGGGVSPEASFLLLLGKKSWPVDLVFHGYLLSAALDIGNWVLFDVGARKTLFEGRALRPWLGGGITALAHSTQEDEKGFPLGFWARGGVDLRAGNRFFAGPFLGYSKYETTTSGNNTGGVAAGMTAGLLW